MQKVLLLILDGWGIQDIKERNAIQQARIPFFNKLWNNFPHTMLDAAGSAVGLPKNTIGNSEVGHLTLGAGRVIESDLLRINRAIRNGSFFKNKILVNTFTNAKRNLEKVHLMGLLSDAGVHAHIDHLFALLQLAKKIGVKQVYVHAFLDGRDTPPGSAKKYIQRLQREMKRLGIGELATMMGRYYAMDRDNRWKREHKAYDCMVNCRGLTRGDPLKALDEYYAQGITDEFVKPTVLLDKCVVDEDDTVIFFNFRSDRARELTRAFVWGEFNEFKRKKIVGLRFVTLTQYDSLVKVPIAFPPVIPHNTLGEVISNSGLQQLRLAETEKWAHVTYFFNGLCECIFPHEKRIHIQSRKVNTYDKTPAMKAVQITNALLRNKEKYDFFVVNFANADMVAHSGNITATKKAVEMIDVALKRIVSAFPGVVIITADHGNAENMSEKWQTSHTTHKVPLIVVNYDCTLKSGGLADVALTILNIMGLTKPKEMTGKSLVN